MVSILQAQGSLWLGRTCVSHMCPRMLWAVPRLRDLGKDLWSTHITPYPLLCGTIMHRSCPCWLPDQRLNESGAKP